ncbi:hypothetical protein O7627_04730 [Solwaraspora sp. WMMD1047]|uniref:HAAS signaling domain-containing protein n=1 Tax=Solwaraspora sp. WMMD1047 TaxID=3016102 RepID=UPI00241651EA|nr:hypothetical protein [Solwaraspora sp. WMMD1047]MDG4828610.1 hypothetical protein [Solwaraspora sp. WMMD1047]
MTVTRDEEITRYVEQVRRELADLPPAVRDELLEDLPEHLTEVAAEFDGPLADRIGTPEAYAAELRTAAGTAPGRPAPNLDQRIATAVAGLRARLRTVDTKVGPTIGYAKASEFLRLLRPAWWVLRGYLVAMLLSTMTSQSPSLLPQVDESYLLGLLVLAGCLVGSIWLGRRTPTLRRWPRLGVHAGTLVVVLFGLFAVMELQNHSDYYYEPTYSDPYSHIQDVYVYDSEGRLLEDVRLFDQNGVPIRIGYPWCMDEFGQRMDEWGKPVPGPVPTDTYPYCPQGAPFRVPSLSPTESASTDAPVPAAPAPTPSAAAPTPSPTDPTAPTADPEPSPVSPSPGD